ncbi:MAG: hypothetical protein KAI67_04015 [Candidatus Pacebacteria bacterium]|nr:hypothetical protein [Candidatus Paceibacterota bacterium]
MDDQNTTNSDDSISKDGDEMSEENAVYLKEIDDLEKIKEEHEAKKKEQLKKIREEREKNKRKIGEQDETEEQRIVAGQVVSVKKRNYKRKTQLFKHKKINDFSGRGITKINKALKGVHGVSAQKKIEFIKALKAYNPSKSILKKDDFVDFTRRFKLKRFSGGKFSNVAKKGIDIKDMRKRFGKRDIDKLTRGITGEEDPNRYKPSSTVKKNSASSSASVRPSR